MNKASLVAALNEYDRNKTVWRRGLDTFFGVGYSRSPAMQALATFIASLPPETTELSSEQIARLKTEVTNLYPARLATGAATHHALAQATPIDLVIDPSLITFSIDADWVARREMEARLTHAARAITGGAFAHPLIATDPFVLPVSQIPDLVLPSIAVAPVLVAEPALARRRSFARLFPDLHHPVVVAAPAGDVYFSPKVKRALGERVLAAIGCSLPDSEEYGAHDAFYRALGNILTQHYVDRHPATTLSLDDAHLAILRNHFQKQLDESTDLLAEAHHLADHEVIPHLMTQLESYHPLAFCELALEVISSLDPAIADATKQLERSELHNRVLSLAEQTRSGGHADVAELAATHEACVRLLKRTNFTETVYYPEAPGPSVAPGTS